MKVAVFSARPYDRTYLGRAESAGGAVEFHFLEPHLTLDTAVLAEGAEAVCLFVNDDASRPVLEALAARGCRGVVLRCAGFNQVDLVAARELGLRVFRVPAYSPNAVAEHALALILALNRKIPRAFNRVRDGNFALDGLLGFDLFRRTVGVVGTGRIGEVFARMMLGLGCRVLTHDPVPNAALEKQGGIPVSIPDLLEQSDIVSLHCPLTPDTRHLIDDDALERMKPGAMLINTSRGALVDTRSLVRGLKTGHLGAVGLDVYEEEADLFFEDRSGSIIQDDLFMRLVTFPNVLITGHQAFFTEEALENIAATTLENLRLLREGRSGPSEVKSDI